MKIARAASCVCIMCMVLAAGIPWVWLNGPSPVVSMGLENAIQSVRQLAEASDAPDSFVNAFRITLSDLRIIAGLDKLFKPAKEANFTRYSSVTDTACPLPASDLSPPPSIFLLSLKTDRHKPSISRCPELPPPESKIRNS